MRLCSFKNE